MAIQTVYYRQKIAGTGWRYRPLAAGRRPEAAKNGPYFIRVRNGAGKYQWVNLEGFRHAPGTHSFSEMWSRAVLRHLRERRFFLNVLQQFGNGRAVG
jgi:hypothetical protein